MPVKIFFCYAREDERLLNRLKTHLKPLQRQGLINIWHDRDISAGAEWEREISKQLNEAQIILLLISPDFMASDYCYSVEMKRAMARHERGEAYVIPVILEHVYWQVEPLSKLQVLPTDAKPVISSNWHNLNEALFNVVEGVCKKAEEIFLGTPENAREKQFSISRQLNRRFSSELEDEQAELTTQEYARCKQVEQALTSRQRDVLHVFAKGRNPQEIAENLCISLSTVSTHSTKIFHECRFAWDLPENYALTYHFLREHFGKYFSDDEWSMPARTPANTSEESLNFSKEHQRST